jgi:dipeptidyl aminopeptidase/acylaminoacyl peptidase
VGHGRVVYSEFADQRLYSLDDPGPRPITAEPERPRSVRFADGRLLHEWRLVCVRETHPEEGEAVNELVTVDLDTGEQTILTTGRDFYANPRPSGDGRLAWLEWDHPNMPWDGTDLMVANLENGQLTGHQHIAGGVDESVFQPDWAPDGALVFSSDRTGWWNLYRWDGEATTSLLLMEADFGSPLWQFGRKAFGFLADRRILAGYWQDGINHLGVVDGDGGFTPMVDGDHSVHERLVTDGDNRAWYGAAGPSVPGRLVELQVDTGEQTIVRTNPMPVGEAYVSEARPIGFPTGDGETSHAIFYPPANPDFAGPEGESPPLIVHVHGGPTSQVFPALRTSFLYWTSRGFAVVDVNYRGSTGYGREYRNKLRGNWGVVDVEDCVAVARHLASNGEVDGDRLVITGGSAGGFTTLAALAFSDVFSAGASYYGVADLGLLAAHTHKFESRYLDGLVAPDEMRERSPLYAADQISVPVILFQGLEDKVVPPEQAEIIADALVANRIPHAHITYEGEDHGFRNAENIIHSLESELAFYGEVLGFVPAGDLPRPALVGR